MHLGGAFYTAEGLRNRRSNSGDLTSARRHIYNGRKVDALSSPAKKKRWLRKNSKMRI